MIIRTTNCSKFGHLEFALQYDPRLVPVEADLHWLVSWLEDSVAQGARFTDGQTCQIGWLLTLVRDNEDNTLTLWEPDMKGFPIQWVHSINHTLFHLRTQKDVVESVLNPDELTFPSLRQSAIICNRLSESAGLVLERTQVSGNDSGWFIGCKGLDHNHNRVDQLTCISLYEVAVRHTERIIPFLALPAGLLLGINQNSISLFLNGEPLEIKPDSYLSKLYSR